MRRMFCKECGTKNDIGDKFCKNCGRQLHEINNQGNINKKPSVFQEKKKPPILLIVGVIAFVAVLFFAREGATLFKSDTKVNCAGYSFTIPKEYETEIVDGNILKLTKKTGFTEETAVIYVYQSNYDQLKEGFYYLEQYNLQNWANYNLNGEYLGYEETTINNKNVLLIDVKVDGHYSTAAMMKISEEYVLGVQTVSTSKSNTRKMAEKLVPVIIEAKRTEEEIKPYNNNMTVSIFELLRRK